MLQSTGAELDLFFKVFCELPVSDRVSIKDYSKRVLEGYTGITTQEVEVKAYGISFMPFDGWNADCPSQSLTWWDAFTSIKHNRTGNMIKASLKNVMYAIGALCLLEMKYLMLITKDSNEINVPDEESAIFTLKGWPRNFDRNIGFTIAPDGSAIIDCGML